MSYLSSEQMSEDVHYNRCVTQTGHTSGQKSHIFFSFYRQNLECVCRLMLAS